MLVDRERALLWAKEELEKLQPQENTTDRAMVHDTAIGMTGQSKVPTVDADIPPKSAWVQPNSGPVDQACSDLKALQLEQQAPPSVAHAQAYNAVE